jgi:ribose transport system permease protein
VSSAEEPARKAARWLGMLAPYAVVVLLLAAFTLLIRLREGPRQAAFFFSLPNLQLIAAHAMLVAAVGVGMTLLMISGGIDLSVGYVVSLVTVTTVLAYRWAGGQEPWASTLAIAVGLATGTLFGLTNGLLVTWLRVLPFVATLGTMGVARGLGQHLAEGRTIGFSEQSVVSPPWTEWLGQVEPEPAWLVFGPGVWSVLLVALAAGVMLRWTVLGRYCFAIGSSEATARLCGIHVSRTKLLLYVLAGLITGWAGVLQTARGRTGSFNVQAGLELEVIAAAVIGGASLSGGEGSVVVTLLGVLAGGAAERLRDAAAGERGAVCSSRLDYRERRRLEQLAPAATALGGVTVHC